MADLSVLYNADGTLKPASYFKTPPASPLPPITKRDRDLVAKHLCGDKSIDFQRFNREASKFGISPITDDVVRDVLPVIPAAHKGGSAKRSRKRTRKPFRKTLRSSARLTKRSVKTKRRSATPPFQLRKFG
jgi:hypothetical protein